MQQDLSGKRVVVTGSRGVIGRWIAEDLVLAGASVCLTDVDAEGDSGLAAQLAGLNAGEGSFAHAADLREAAQIDALVAEVGTRWGGADVLVNNAGVYPSGFLLDTDAEEWDRIFDINLRAPFLLSRGFARQMVAQGIAGNIVNISSGGSRSMRLTAAPYCTSKAALDRLTKGFAQELAQFGIRVNALEPGFAPGSMVSVLTEAHVKAVTANIPLGRLTAREDIGNAVRYLASAASSYVTGTTLTVDGGNSIGSLVIHQAKKTPL
jgi:3-oxoacyl-[acyl-carrier protein] reductase